MKSKDRIHECYKEGTKDWDAQHNMLLEDGITCGECAHKDRCWAMFGQSMASTKCQFHPNRFYPLTQN